MCAYKELQHVEIQTFICPEENLTAQSEQHRQLLDTNNAFTFAGGLKDNSYKSINKGILGL